MTRLVDAFWRALSVPGREVWGPCAEAREAQARTLVRVFYALLTVDAMGFGGRSLSLLQRGGFRPLWPVAWVDGLISVEVAALALPFLFFVGSLAALLFPAYRSARTLAFVSALLYFALINSYGKIDHGGHAKILIAFTFIWLPRGRAPGPPGAWSLGVLGAQMVLGLLYSMAGLWKVAAIPVQLYRGHRTSLHLDGLAAQLADRLLQTDTDTLLGPLMIEHAPFFAPLLWGAIAVELIALPAVFRPGWHRPAGVMVIALHAGLYASIGIGFGGHALLMGIFFVTSPFARPISVEERLRTAPLVGPALDAWAAVRSAGHTQKARLFIRPDAASARWLRARFAPAAGVAVVDGLSSEAAVEHPATQAAPAVFFGPDGVVRIGAHAVLTAALVAGVLRPAAAVLLLVPPLFLDLAWAAFNTPRPRGSGSSV